MIIFPAIDLKDNQCVRLTQGQFDAMNIYDEDPIKVAQAFEQEGAKYLHIIDLNGAQNGLQVNLKTIEALGKTLKIPFQVGGGIRSIEAAEKVLQAGASRIILGTAAINDLDLLKKLVGMYKEQVIVSIDARARRVAIKGWAEITDISVLDLCKTLEDIGIRTVVYTDIEKDGMLQGPNIEDYQLLVTHTKLNVIASGGVTTLDDVIKLNDIGLYGAIIGKAIYEKKINLKEAITCSQSVSSPV